MKIAIPILYGRVAPLADVAENWMFIARNARDNREIHEIRENPVSLPSGLRERDVTIVICNGISPLLARMFQSMDIQVYWGIRGYPDEALERWQRGELKVRGRCGRRRRRRFHGR